MDYSGLRWKRRQAKTATDQNGDMPSRRPKMQDLEMTDQIAGQGIFHLYS